MDLDHAGVVVWLVTVDHVHRVLILSARILYL
jgi:hypothetical protein